MMGTVSSGPSGRSADVVVVGGGVIGLAVAWCAAKASLTPVVVDPDPGSGASFAAAGMLAPVTEAHYGEEELVQLNLAGAALWPRFAAELEAEAGEPVGYLACGTLAVAADGDDWAVLRELHRFEVELGLSAELLTPRECRHLEPLLAPGIRGGLLAVGDHQVDSRAVLRALLAALERQGVEVRREAVAELVVRGGRAAGVRLAGGDEISSDAVVLSAGCWSAGIGGLPPEAAPPVRPVKGQILRLAGPASAKVASRTVRGFVRGSPVYLVPRSDGRVVVGATAEEQGFDTTVQAGAVFGLLRDAIELIPAVGELELVEARAGLRPGSPDNAPLVGRSPLPGLAVATGHYRNGMLLAPITAMGLTSLLAGGAVPVELEPFAPTRFASPGTPAQVPVEVKPATPAGSSVPPAASGPAPSDDGSVAQAPAGRP
jgi:glycine oxidase